MDDRDEWRARVRETTLDPVNKKALAGISSFSPPNRKKKETKETIIEEQMEVTCAGAQKRRKDSAEQKSKKIF